MGHGFEPWSRKIPHATEQLSACATTTEAHVPRAGALQQAQQEKPPQWEVRAPQQRVAPTRRNQRKPARSNEDPTQPKINK